MMPTVTVRPRWSSSTWFVLVCAASVVSLGNMWRLPSLVADYGGGAFLLVYVGVLLTMGLPLFSGQLLMARGSGADLPGVIAAWTRAGPHSRVWVWSGYLIVAGTALLLAAYGVIGSWSFAYSLRSVIGTLNIDSMDAAQVQFIEFARDSERGFGWLLLFIGLVAATAARGLRRGVEPVMRTLSVLIVLILLALLLSTALDADAPEAIQALIGTDFSALGWRGTLEAFYQAFFTLSLGTGVIVVFGSYLPESAPVIRLSLIVIAIDLAVSLVFAFMLAVFVGGQDVGMGAGLQQLFEALPVALGGGWRMPIMFVLIALLSLTTVIGLFEPLVQLVQHRSGLSRLRSTWYAGVGVGLLGLLGLLAFGPLDDWRLFDHGMFGWMLLIASQVIVPLTGVLLCMLMGRVLARRRLLAAWSPGESRMHRAGFALWHGLLRYPTRIALIVVLFYSLGMARLAEMIWQQ